MSRIVPAQPEKHQSEDIATTRKSTDNSVLTREKIFSLCSPFVNLEFFNKIGFTKQQLYNDEFAKQLTEFYEKIDSYFALNCHKHPAGEEIPHPLENVYSYIKQKKYGNILSLKGANGTGKSIFCNALFIYLLNLYKNPSDIVPLYFDTDGCLNNASNTDINSWDETKNWGQGWKDSFTWSNIKQILDEFIASAEELLKQNHTVCLIIDGAYDKFILPKDIVGRALEQHTKRLKSTYKNLKIIISEDTYDYFNTSEFSERDWLESNDTIMFNGCENLEFEQLKSCVERYCALMRIADNEALFNKVLNTQPIFRLDMRLLGILSKTSGPYDMGKYYYDDVINKVNINSLSNVARDMFIDGQISESWDSSNKKELALLLDDEYAFYYFTAYSFVSQWKNIETDKEIFSNELFISMIENRSSYFLNVKMIYFIKFLFSKESIEQKKVMLNKANELVEFLCGEYLHFSDEFKLIALKIMNSFIFIVGKLDDNSQIHSLKCRIFNTICGFPIISGTYLYGIEQGISDKQFRYLSGLLHCCHLYSIYLNCENDDTFNFYLSQIGNANSVYKSMLNAIIPNCLAYYGGKFGDEDQNLFLAINSLFLQVQSNSVNERYNRINIEMDLVIFVKSFEFISTKISKDIKAKLKRLIKYVLQKDLIISDDSKKVLTADF